jgi:TatD related DNase
LLIETDSPYLAPVPFRGKTNEPGFVPKVAEKLAELKNVSVEEVAAASTSNFFNLFRPVGNKLDANGKESRFWEGAINQSLTSES